MAVSYRERIRRCLMINGAYFDDHAIDRARDRIGMTEQQILDYEEKIIELQGEVYYDKEYGNYQISFDKLAFAFDLKLHNEKPGLIAYVKTAITNPNDFREEDTRFRKLDFSNKELSEKDRLQYSKTTG